MATRPEVGEENWDLVRYLAGESARLVVTGRNEATNEETVEVVHEALIREWQRLREWMEGDRTFRTWQERLRLAMRQWESSGNDEGALLRGTILAEAEDWLQQRLEELSLSERKFIEKSLELREREKAEKEARELEKREIQITLQAQQEANQILTEANQKAKWRIRIGSSVLAVSLIVATTTGIQAVRLKQVEATLEATLKDSLKSLEIEKQGLAYYTQGEYVKAIKYHQQYLTIARAINDRKSEGEALGILGIVYHSLGNYPKAIDYHQLHLAISREIKDRRGEGEALGNLGVVYHSLGDYPKAIDYHQLHLAISREIKDRRGEGEALGNLGVAFHSLGDYPKAIDYHQLHLAISRNIKDRRGEGEALGNLGVAFHSLGDYPKAIDYHQAYLAISREIKDRQGEGEALGNLGTALLQSGNLLEAQKTLYEGIKVWESLRGGLSDNYKVSILGRQANTYRTLQKVLIAQKKADSALEIAERMRARAFVELLSSKLDANPKQQLDTAPNIAQIKQIAKTQNATIVEYSIIYDDFKIQGKQQAKESNLYIWVVKPTGEIGFRSVDLSPLNQQKISLQNLVFDNLSSISSQSSPNAKNLNLHQLYQSLIQPIADLLPKKQSERVIFIPQTELFLVPFPALRDEHGKYLIEKHTILTAPEIQVLDLTHKQRQQVAGKNKDALVIGNPTMPKIASYPGEPLKQLPTLPGAEIEAKEVAAILKTDAIIGNQATKAAILSMLPKARIIHFATHGILDDLRGLGSAIALAPSDKDNGLLTAEEILNLKLNAELVVLSASNTGRGRITDDGVIGLSRSLISAGVPSVIVSLWSIPDAPTVSLMTDFYQRLQQGNDKASALRQAMLSTMKQYPEPRDWAGFTLIGESQ